MMAGGVGSGWLLDVDGDLVLVRLAGGTFLLSELETGIGETGTLLSTGLCRTEAEVGSNGTVVVVGDGTGKGRLIDVLVGPACVCVCDRVYVCLWGRWEGRGSLITISAHQGR